MPNTSRNFYTRQKRTHANLEKRRHGYYATLAVPKDLRAKLGKHQFFASLKTDSEKTALERLPVKLALWRAQIAEARQTSPEDEDAAWYRNAFAEAKTDKEREQLRYEIEQRADDIAYRKMDWDRHDRPSQVPEAQQFYEQATATKTPFAAHLDDWQKGTDVTDKTRAMRKADVLRFAAMHPHAQEVTAAKVQQWVSSLDVKPKTVRRILSALRGYWKYLQRSDVAVAPRDLFPFNGIDLPRKSRKGTADYRKPFPPDAIPMLISGAESDQSLQNLIRLGAYTGCRIEELCSLEIANVHETYLDIIDAKTEAGVRQVPLHAAIKQLVARLLEESKDGYLLSGLTENKFGDRSNAIGKRFGRLKTRLGYGPQFVFHSIRRTVATALKEALVPEVVAADILGHEIATMSYGLYAGGVSLDVKRKALAKVKY